MTVSCDHSGPTQNLFRCLLAHEDGKHVIYVNLKSLVVCSRSVFMSTTFAFTPTCYIRHAISHLSVRLQLGDCMLLQKWYMNWLDHTQSVSMRIPIIDITYIKYYNQSFSFSSDTVFTVHEHSGQFFIATWTKMLVPVQKLRLHLSDIYVQWSWKNICYRTGTGLEQICTDHIVNVFGHSTRTTWNERIIMDPLLADISLV